MAEAVTSPGFPPVNLRKASRRNGDIDSFNEKKSRKREQDRLCQQRKRRKDRELIQGLEEKVKTLHQQAEDKVLYEMQLKREKDKMKISRHLERARKIQTLIQADIDDLTDEKEVSSALKNKGFDEEACEEKHGTCALSEASEPSDPFTSNNESINFPDFQLDFGTSSKIDPDAQIQPMNSWDADEAILNSLDMSFNFASSVPSRLETSTDPTTCFFGSTNKKCDSGWLTMNSVIERAHQLLCEEFQYQLGLEAHIIITAVLRGWEAVSQAIQLSTHWKTLRQIDEFCFITRTGKIERLASLMFLRRMLMSRNLGEDELHKISPTFLRPRPVQLHVPHAALVDYFVWPGFRERLIFNRKEYCDDKFGEIFQRNLSFAWPFEVRDAYVQNRENKLYQFSQTFLERVNDLRFWCLNQNFFNAYPDFCGDAPMSNSIPRQISHRIDFSEWSQFETRSCVSGDENSHLDINGDKHWIFGSDVLPPF